MDFIGILDFVDEYIWYIAFVLIIGVGLFATVALRGLQITSLGEMARNTFKRDKASSENKLSSFQVFCMSMGSRIGVGNITGPIMALLVGGPGAILWMWVFAGIGMATSFLETIIGQIYKVPKENGGFRGGPAYTLFHGLGMKKLGMVAAFVMIMMYLLGFVSGEVISMSEAVQGAFDYEWTHLVFAIVLTLVTGLILIGGVYRVADLSVKIVPAMAICWFIICIASMVLAPAGVIHAFGTIFEYALNAPALVGGGIGVALMNGMRRGVWSNESGIGTITNLSAMADVKHPVAQAYTQSFGVLIDTLVSTMTALVVLSYADFDVLHGMYIGAGEDSIPVLQAIFSDTIGSIAPYVVAVFMFIFAFTCLISDVVIGEGNLMLIKDSKAASIAMKLFLLAVVFLSCFFASDEMTIFMDILLAVCALFNTYIMVRLAKRGLEAYRDYRAQKKAGIEEPVFRKECLSDDSGISSWD